MPYPLDLRARPRPDTAWRPRWQPWHRVPHFTCGAMTSVMAQRHKLIPPWGILSSMSTRIERLAQQAVALELRLQGLSLRAIAQRMGVPLKTVERRVKTALRDLPLETPDEVRRTVETRYDGLLTRQYALLDSGKLTPSEQTQIVNSIGQLEDRRVRLLGVAVPASLVVQVEQADSAATAPPTRDFWKGV